MASAHKAPVTTPGAGLEGGLRHGPTEIQRGFSSDRCSTDVRTYIASLSSSSIVYIV